VVCGRMPLSPRARLRAAGCVLLVCDDAWGFSCATVVRCDPATGVPLPEATVGRGARPATDEEHRAWELWRGLPFRTRRRSAR